MILNRKLETEGYTMQCLTGMPAFSLCHPGFNDGLRPEDHRKGHKEDLEKNHKVAESNQLRLAETGIFP